MDREAVKLGINQVKSQLDKKKVVFITTKNLDYIRNTQEINLIKSSSPDYKIIGSANKKYFVRLLKVYTKILITNFAEYDVVFIGFAPQLILPIWKRKFKKNHVLVDFFISMYDTFVNDRQKFGAASFVSKVLKMMDKKTLENADTIISDTKAHGKYFAEELGAEKKKLITLYLEANKKIYYPRKAERPDCLKDKFIVLYFGSVLPLQGVDIVLEAYNLLKNDNRFYFYLIGEIGKKYYKPQSENIEYIDWLPQEKLAEYIAMADLCLAGHFCDNIDKAKRTIPGKAYIYYAMEKKIVLGDNDANKELFKKSKKTYFVPMGDGAAIMEVIRNAMVRQCVTKESFDLCGDIR